MVPVSLATRKRKPVLELPLIAGLSMGSKTANEIAAESAGMPPVLDAMNASKPS